MSECQAALQAIGQTLNELLLCTNVSVGARETAQVNQIAFQPSRHFSFKEKGSHMHLELWIQANCGLILRWRWQQGTLHV